MQEKWSLIKGDEIFQWLLTVTKKLEQNSFEFGLIILYTIWNNRNAFIIQGNKRTGQDVGRFVTSYLQEYKQAITKKERQGIRER